MSNTPEAGAAMLPGMGSSLSRTSTAIRVSQEEFNIQSTQRKIILRQLSDALLGQGVPAPFWAVIQVCDLQKLEYLVQCARLSLKIMDIIADLVCSLPYNVRTIRGRSIPPKSRYDARERDKYRCVITGARQVYHSTPIFPTAASTSNLHDDMDFPSLWRFVDFFWDKGTAERWRKAVFSNRTDPRLPVNDCSNLICLRADIRSAWAKGLFALRPFWKSEDETQLDIEFYWQPKNEHQPYDLIDVLKEPMSSKDAQAVEQLNVVVPVHRRRSRDQHGENDTPEELRPIKSGHRFRMTTDDPDARPLPNFDLLDMQWHFSRIVGFSNADAIFQHDDQSEYQYEARSVRIDDDARTVRIDDDARTIRLDDDEIGPRIFQRSSGSDILGWLHSSPTISHGGPLEVVEEEEEDEDGDEEEEQEEEKEAFIEDISTPVPSPDMATDRSRGDGQRTASSGSLGDSVRAFGHLSIDL